MTTQVHTPHVHLSHSHPRGTRIYPRCDGGVTIVQRDRETIRLGQRKRATKTRTIATLAKDLRPGDRYCEGHNSPATVVSVATTTNRHDEPIVIIQLTDGTLSYGIREHVARIP